MNNLELVDYVRELGSLPDGRFSTDQVLLLADGEITDIYMDILAVRSDYMVETVTVSGTSFRIPQRAIGQKVRDIIAKRGTEYVNVPRFDPSDLPADAVGYYYRNNTVYMNRVHEQLPGATFEVSYYARPGKLISTGSAAQCTNVSATGSTWSGPRLSASSYDLIKGTSGFETISASFTVTTASSVGSSYPYTSIVSSVYTGLEVGDWLSARDTSPVPQLPDEFHTVLGVYTIARCLDSIGDKEGYARAREQATAQMETAMRTIAERDDGHPEKFRLDWYSPWIYSSRWRWR